MTEEMAPYTVTSLPGGQKRRRKAGAKFVALAISSEGDLVVLDNSGRAWELDSVAGTWRPLPPHPEAAP